MKDAEFIYALYVQANPVPDPDLLSLTRDEAVLLTLERSPDMITQEQAEEHQPASSPRRSRLAAAFGTAAVLIVAVGAVVILVSGNSRPPVAADANPVVEFDGTSCSYDGPTKIEEGMVKFSITNTADRDFTFATIRMEEPALSQSLEGLPIGSDIALEPDVPLPEGTMRFVLISPNESKIEDRPMAAGVYVFDCVAGEPTEHVWRVAQMEVVTP